VTLNLVTFRQELRQTIFGFTVKKSDFLFSEKFFPEEGELLAEQECQSLRNGNFCSHNAK